MKNKDIQKSISEWDLYRNTIDKLNRFITGELVKRISAGEVTEKILNYFIVTNPEMNLIGIRKYNGSIDYKILTWLQINVKQKWIKLAKRKFAYKDEEDLFKAVMMVIDYYEGRIPNTVVLLK